MTEYNGIKVGEHIDYKRPAEAKLTTGKVLSFCHAPESDSVWMLVVEIENIKNKDWIPFGPWKEMKDAGFFENKLQTKLIETNVDNQQPSGDTDLPF